VCGTSAGVGFFSILALIIPQGRAEANMPVTPAPPFPTPSIGLGFYIGAHAGFGRCASNAVLIDPATPAKPQCSSTAMIAGVQPI